MTDNSEHWLQLEAYRVARETRNLEINLFWQRSNYFLALSSAIGVAFFSLKDPKYSRGIAGFGFVVSLLWICVNLGSKFWQSRWEHRLSVVERQLSPDMNLFSASWDTVRRDVEQSFQFKKHGPLHRFYTRMVLFKPSVTRMMIALSALFALFWLVLILIP